jgi:hypothetical protein
LLKPRCTTASRLFVSRHLLKEALERMKVRVRANSNLMSQRRCAAEHPFGTLKRMTLSVLAYATLSAPVNLAGTEEPSAGLA